MRDYESRVEHEAEKSGSPRCLMCNCFHPESLSCVDWENLKRAGAEAVAKAGAKNGPDPADTKKVLAAVDAHNDKEAAIQKWVDLAVAQLDHLNPIYGFDLLHVCAVRPIDGGMLTTLYNEMLEDANVWGSGTTIRKAWANVLDCMAEISQHTRKAGI